MKNKYKLISLIAVMLTAVFMCTACIGINLPGWWPWGDKPAIEIPDETPGGETPGDDEEPAYSGPSQPIANLEPGSLVRDNKTKYAGEPIVWLVAAQNWYGENSTVLLSEKLLDCKEFDSAEPDNYLAPPGEVISTNGDSCFAFSNIRQWLNSPEAAGRWYSPQHQYDAAPSYVNEAGFMSNFSKKFADSLLDITYKLGSSSYHGGVTFDLTDKVRLCDGDESGGSPKPAFPILKTDSGRKAFGTQYFVDGLNARNAGVNIDLSTGWPWFKCVRYNGTYSQVSIVTASGSLAGTSYANANNRLIGLRPLCNISSAVKITEAPDDDGVYTIVF